MGKSSYFVYGSVEGKIKKYVDWGADAKFYPSGYRGGDVSFGANLALTGYIRKRPLILEGRFRMETRSPDYWQELLSVSPIMRLRSVCGKALSPIRFITVPTAR